MAIKSFDKDEVVSYVPQYNKNRESDTPCIVRLKFVPYSKVQEYSRLIASKLKGVNTPLGMAEVTQLVQRKQFTDCVHQIKGYFIGSKEVTDPEDFYNTADTELIVEIIKAMESQSKLSEGLIN